MGKKNKKIIQRLYDEVLNEKRVDLLDEFFSEDYAYHSAPYVGLGFVPDVSSGSKFVVVSTAPNGPTDGKLLPGDEILQVEDDENTWSSYKEIENGFWGRGIAGTKVRIKVKRGETIQNIELERGLIEGYDLSFNDLKPNFIRFLKEDYPDLQVTINAMISKGDMVATAATYNGTDSQFKRQAIWNECTFSRLANGKIVEEWGASDNLTQLTQLGYKVTPPPLK